MTEAEAAVAPFAQVLSRPVGDVAADLERFRQLLTKWQPAQNLVSRETLGSFWTRHVADSLQLLPLVRNTDSRFLDLGSGGGLPALPLAIALRRTHVLVESNARKVSFLRTVARELALPVTVVSERVERIDSRETPDVITARGFASLQQTFVYAAHLFTPLTHAILHKGRGYRDELRDAGAAWAFDVVVHPSVVEADSVVLEVANLRPKTAA